MDDPLVAELKCNVWSDNDNYHFAGELLTRRKCGFHSCLETTQLELCTSHLRDAGLEVKESGILNSGWGLFTTRDRVKNELICYFSGTEIIGEIEGSSEYISWRGGGVYIDSSIERCSAACANASRKNNCSIKLYRKKCCIRTKKSLRNGDEIYIAYGRTYRW